LPAAVRRLWATARLFDVGHRVSRTPSTKRRRNLLALEGRAWLLSQPHAVLNASLQTAIRVAHAVP
jgi:hypothetical protein